MTSLTTYFPPVTAGDFYTPAMMEYDGSTGYYSSTITTSGNKITLIARFKILPETGNGYQTIAWCAGSTPRTRLAFYAGDTDIADTTHRNKLVMYGTDSSGTVTCRLVSTIDVNDGNTYTAFGSYDGDTGAATFYINGADVDDVGTGGRVLTTGTLEAGASSVFYTGAAGSANWKNGGEIGYVGMAEVYLTNWSDFMDPQGNPKDIEDNPSTVWGGTPLFWNQYGDMENNLGSAGAMTRNGSIVVSDDGTTGSSYALSATAVNTDILTGKTAWVNGQKVTGTLISTTLNVSGGVNGIMFEQIFPTGLSGAYTPFNTTASDIMIQATENTYAPVAGTIDTSGRFKYNSTFVGGLITPPTKTTSLRRMSGRVYTPAFGSTESCGIKFNYQDAANYWIMTLTWYNASNIQGAFYEVISGSGTARGGTANAAATAPCYIDFLLFDRGDAIQCIFTAGGSPGNISYTIASRSKQNEVNCGFSSWSAATFYYSRFRIEDL